MYILQCTMYKNWNPDVCGTSVGGGGGGDVIIIVTSVCAVKSVCG